MATAFLRTLVTGLVPLALAACGGQELDTPTDLDVTTYPAGTGFTMSLTMTSCSDICAEYDGGSCDVSVDEEARLIEVDASIGFDRVVDDGECVNRCGPPVFVHCDVPALDAGTYVVEANGFRRTVTVR